MKWFSSRAARRAVAVFAPICLAAAITGGCSAVDEPKAANPGGTGSASTATLSGKQIADMVEQLAEAPEASMSGYSRERFPHWDTNKPEHGFGPEFTQYSRCTSRDVMMLRDAVGTVTLDPKTCDLHVGKDGGWRDEYGFLDSKTGKLKPYKWMTDPSSVDAEHIVALAEAWRSGAGKLDEDTRRRIANDAVNLEASDPSANRSKGDQDVANYLPPGTFRCVYLERYITIKVKYGLAVDPAEHAALRTAVKDCASRGEFR